MATLTMPTTSGFQTSRFQLVSPTQMFRSPLSGATQTAALSGARWEASYKVPAVERATAIEWQAFFAELAGRAGRFYGHDPAAVALRGTGAGTPLVNGASQTGNSLITDGWNAATTVLKGDYIAFDTSVGRELKMAIADATADGSGNMTISIRPPIRTSPANNATIIIASASCVMMLGEDVASWDVDEALFYGFAFRGVEALVA